MKCRKRQVRYRGKTDEIQRETVRCAVREEEETARLHMARQAPCVICLFLCQKRQARPGSTFSACGSRESDSHIKMRPKNLYKYNMFVSALQ